MRKSILTFTHRLIGTKTGDFRNTIWWLYYKFNHYYSHSARAPSASPSFSYSLRVGFRYLLTYLLLLGPPNEPVEEFLTHLHAQEKCRVRGESPRDGGYQSRVQSQRAALPRYADQFREVATHDFRIPASLDVRFRHVEGHGRDPTQHAGESAAARRPGVVMCDRGFYSVVFALAECACYSVGKGGTIQNEIDNARINKNIHTQHPYITHLMK